MNTPDVDPAALAREADAIADTAPGPLPPPHADTPGAPAALPPGELTPEQIQAIAARSSAGLVGMVAMVGAALAPNWHITDEESRSIGEAAALAMAAWFPDGALPYKYWVLLQLGGSVFGVVSSRKDPATGKLIPLKAPAPVASSDAPATAAA